MHALQGAGKESFSFRVLASIILAKLLAGARNMCCFRDVLMPLVYSNIQEASAASY